MGALYLNLTQRCKWFPTGKIPETGFLSQTLRNVRNKREIGVNDVTIRTLIKKKGRSNSIENPLSPTDFYSMCLKRLQVVLQVKSPSYSWCFVFVFPLPPIVKDGRIASCSFKKSHEISHPWAYSGISGKISRILVFLCLLDAPTCSVSYDATSST
jgi:hypothetical protein